MFAVCVAGYLLLVVYGSLFVASCLSFVVDCRAGVCCVVMWGYSVLLVGLSFVFVVCVCCLLS